MIHLDSSCLIDLQREPSRSRPGAALELIESLDENELLGVSVHVVCERLLAATMRGGKTMPTMDLLIATAAIVDDATLVTKNVKDFSRVPGLRVLRY